MKPLSELIRDWSGVTAHINELMKDKLPRIIGVESVRAVNRTLIYKVTIQGRVLRRGNLV